MESLRVYDKPYADAGIENLYRYAAFDPFTRSKYFGSNLDLGQVFRCNQASPCNAPGQSKTSISTF